MLCSQDGCVAVLMALLSLARGEPKGWRNCDVLAAPVRCQLRWPRKNDPYLYESR